ncbi:WD repeat-containing protein 87-like [Thomomys bottae]
MEQLSNTIKQMEVQHFYPIKRDLLTGPHTSVDRQTLALMFQKDLTAFKGKGRPLKLSKLVKKKQLILRNEEEAPLWETFVALYYILRMLQQRYGKDPAAWMEQFYHVMDLYQLKSPGIQKLLQELLLREKTQPQEVIGQEALKTLEGVPGERLFYCLICGASHSPSGSLSFQSVIPISEKNMVDTIEPWGIAQYGFLELAWKRLPQVTPYCSSRLSTILPPAL